MADTSPEHPRPLGWVVEQVRGWVGRLGPIWVEGQVTEIKRRQGATQYLTLRDRHADTQASLSCSTAVLDAAGPLTEGAEVVAWVKPVVWSRTGSLNFECREIRATGEGRLLAAIEQRKRLLQAEGLFDPIRKKRLPFAPQVIGLITAPGSDAERDVVTTVGRRWPTARVVTRATPMQGAQCAEQVILALGELDQDQRIQVIIVARGGGALADLLPFYDEGVARAVAACRTPVVSAIGHEADTPIIDLVADVRASTPTDAGKRVVPDAAEQAQGVRDTRERARRAITAILATERARLADLTSRPVLRDPLANFAIQSERLATLRGRLDRGIDQVLTEHSRSLGHDLQRMRAMSPKATLERGYAILVDGAGVGVTSTRQVDADDDLLAYLADGTLTLQVRETHPTTSTPPQEP